MSTGTILDTLIEIDGKLPAAGTLPTNAAQETGGNLATLVARTPALGQTTKSASSPVVLPSDQTVAVSQASPVTSSSSSVTSVAASASSATLLSSNASRKAAYFFNDSTSVAYLKLGATASTSSYTVQLPVNGYYELPTAVVYTGQIDCIWTTATGNMRITELS